MVHISKGIERRDPAILENIASGDVIPIHDDFITVIEYDRIDLFKAIMQEIPDFDRTVVFKHIVIQKRLNFLKYLVESLGIIPEDNLLLCAAKWNRLEIMKYLVSIGLKINYNNYEALERAILYDKTDIIKYLVSIGSPTRQFIHWISTGEIMSLLVSKAIPIDEDYSTKSFLYELATKYGHTVLKDEIDRVIKSRALATQRLLANKYYDIKLTILSSE